MAVNGTFDKWDAALTLTSTDVTTGVLDIQDSRGRHQYRKWHEGRQAEGERLLDVKEGLLITFLSKKIVQTGPNAFDVQGDFTIRGGLNPRR